MTDDCHDGVLRISAGEFEAAFRAEDGVIVAGNWNGAVYRFRITDGAVLLAPPPVIVPAPRYGRGSE